MKRFLAILLCLLLFCSHTVTSQNDPENNKWASMRYAIGTNIPYVQEAIVAGTLLYSSISCLVDVLASGKFTLSSSSSLPKTNNAQNNQSIWSPDTAEYSNSNYHDPFDKFRDLARQKRPFIPNGSIKDTVYEELEQFKNPEYRAFLKTFPEYQEGICTLANSLKTNSDLARHAQKIMLQPCNKCSSKHKSSQSLASWVFDRAYAIESQQQKQTQKGRLAQAQNILNTQTQKELESLHNNISYTQQKEFIIAEQRELSRLYNQFELDAYHQRLISLAHSSLEQALLAIDANDPELYAMALARKNAILETVAANSHLYSNTLIINDNVKPTIGQHINLAPYEQLNATSLEHQINNETIQIFEQTAKIITENQHPSHWNGLSQVIAHLGEGIRSNRINRSYLYSFDLLDITHGIARIAAKSIYNGCARIASSLIEHPIETIADTALLLTLPNVAMTKFIASLVINYAQIGNGIEELIALIATDPEEGLSQAGGFLFEMFVVHKGFQAGHRYGPSTIASLKRGISSFPRSGTQSRQLFSSMRMKFPELETIGKNLRNSVTNALRRVDGWAGQFNNVVYESMQLQALALAEEQNLFKLSSAVVKEPKSNIDSKTISSSKKSPVTIENVTMKDVFERLRPYKKIDPSHQLEALLDDGMKVVVRKDIGKYAHAINPEYPQITNHYNIEIQKPKITKRTDRTSYKIIKNIHIILNKDLKPIKALIK